MVYYKIMVFVPLTHADAVRQAVGEAGAGKIGNYSFSSFSTRGVGRFKPETGANPAIGDVGRFEEVEEERIEFVCPKNKMDEVLAALRRAHPYEEMAHDVFELVSWSPPYAGG